jgi:hypothetical protein
MTAFPPAGPRPRRRALIACAASLVLALSTDPAAAAPAWSGGTVERSQVINCPSQIAGSPYPEVGTMTNAELYADPDALPRVGDVFYARTIPGAVGRPCADQAVAVEVVPPVGVQVAISDANPVRCVYFDIDSGLETPVGADQGCPRQATPGVYGLALNRTGAQGPTWTLPYGKALRIEVPLRATRTLAGIGGGTPSCPRREGEPPCRPDQSGDSLQFAVHVLDGNADPWLSPYVGLVVAPGAGTPGGSALALVVPRSLRIRRAARGFRIEVGVAAANATVSARLTARGRGRLGGRLLARATRRRVPAGQASLRLKLSRSALRALRRARRVGASLRVTVRIPGRPTASATRSITLRR